MIPYIYAIISCTTVVLMQLNMKIVTQTLSPIYALYARGFGLLVLNSLIIRSSGIKIDLKDPELFRMIVKRSFYTSVALICFLGSTPFIPIAIVNSLYNVGPILIFFIESYVLKVYQKPILEKNRFNSFWLDCHVFLRNTSHN